MFCSWWLCCLCADIYRYVCDKVGYICDTVGYNVICVWYSWICVKQLGTISVLQYLYVCDTLGYMWYSWVQCLYMWVIQLDAVTVDGKTLPSGLLSYITVSTLIFFVRFTAGLGRFCIKSSFALDFIDFCLSQKQHTACCKKDQRVEIHLRCGLFIWSQDYYLNLCELCLSVCLFVHKKTKRKHSKSFETWENIRA